MSKYIAEIEFHLSNDAGDEVPYTICVTEYFCQQANPYADSDMDFYGYEDVAYDLLDENGKVVASDEYEDEIEELITEYFQELARNEY
jgi:hypothetical protein